MRSQIENPATLVHYLAQRISRMKGYIQQMNQNLQMLMQWFANGPILFSNRRFEDFEDTIRSKKFTLQKLWRDAKGLGSGIQEMEIFAQSLDRPNENTDKNHGTPCNRCGASSSVSFTKLEIWDRMTD